MSLRHFRTLLTEHTILLGFAVAVIPLAILLILQFRWLTELDRASAVAHRAALRSWAETVGTEVEYFHRANGERLLNVPAALFEGGDISRIAEYWSSKPREGVRRLFVIDFTREPTGNFYIYDPASSAMVPSAASDESLAIVLATLPWQRWARGSNAVETLGLQVNESDPSHRIVLRPIVGEDSMVIGVVGFVLEPSHLVDKLLPRIVGETIASFFAPEVRSDLSVTARDSRGELVFGDAAPGSTPPEVQVRIPFVFSDFTIAVKSEGPTRDQWLGGRFGFNMTIGFLSAAVLIAGIALALLSAERAMRLSQMKSDFVSNVSHELRTPLASIRLFAELLRSGKVKSMERVVEYGDYIETESRRLSRLIDNILDFSRIESKQKEYRLEPTNVLELVRSVLHAFEVRLEQGGFPLELVLPEAPGPTAKLDADAVGQALHNLIDNAAKYSEPGKPIEVRLAEKEGCAVISVRDRGIGIAKADQSKVFERFHRVGTGLVHDVKGSGLGLSIVKHVAEAHGGYVKLESEPGKGSTFSLHLPLCSPQEEGADHAETADRGG